MLNNIYIEKFQMFQKAEYTNGPIDAVDRFQCSWQI